MIQNSVTYFMDGPYWLRSWKRSCWFFIMYRDSKQGRWAMRGKRISHLHAVIHLTSLSANGPGNGSR